MGSYMNFKKFGDPLQQGDSREKSSGGNPLVRQSSIYSLTFEELQTTLGGSGKDFGSMNMEELLKTIWTAEESEAVATCAGGGNTPIVGGNLQRQGSLTLPWTLSQKTVDEAWSDVLKEPIGVKDGNGNGNGGLNLGPREPLLSAMTLEDFLARAGVVREDIQLSGMSTSTAKVSTLPLSNVNNSSRLNTGFQQTSQNHDGVVINMNGARSCLQPQLHSLFPKQATIAFSSSVQADALLSDARANGPVGMPNVLSKSMAPESGSIVRGGFSMQGSPVCFPHSDSKGKCYMDTPSASLLPFNFSEGGGGPRSSGPLEKVVERRRKRMIKNRESAARSRARKRAYTLELEAEVAKLRKINEELRRKREEFAEMQKNKDEILETTNGPFGSKRRCLRRTLTGPW